MPPNCTVVGNPGRIVQKKKPQQPGEIDLDQVNLPDPMLDKMRLLYERLSHMEQCLLKRAQQLGCDGCGDHCALREDIEQEKREKGL